jgi:hypothetical protein
MLIVQVQDKGPALDIHKKYHTHWNFCVLFMCVLFSCTHCSFLQPSKNHPCKQCMIKLDVSSLKVSSSDTIRPEFLALVHNISRMIVSDKKKIKGCSWNYRVGHKPLTTLCKSQSMRNRWITTIRDLIRPRGKSLGGVTLTAAIL